MNTINVNNSFFHPSAIDRAFKNEPSLWKFISIIMAKKELKEAFQQKKIATWLREVNYDLDKAKDFLGKSKIMERLNIARLYAKILAQYVPDEIGDINQDFNYLQLVSLIKKVFNNHLWQKTDNLFSDDLFTKGLKIVVSDLSFYAKVESGQIFMFLAKAKNYIGEGYYGIVGKVYEIAMGQMRAVKWATENPEANESINQEIVTLKKIHKLAETRNCSLEGIQDLPLATFSLNEFNAFLSPEYGVELQEWSKKTHSNEERISICKSIVRTFCEKCKLGYWHGDLKPENILMNGKGVVIIDWAGSLPFHEAVLKFKTPTLSPFYTHFEDFKKRELIIEKFKLYGLTDDLKLEFLNLAYSMELFSLSIALFMTLVPVKPFFLVFEEDCDVHFPLTRYGIKEESMELLLKRKYSDEVVKTITKMLAHLPQDRYDTPEAIKIWKNIK